MNNPHVGFIGLGTMGFPMAENLLQAGYPLVGYDLADAPRDAITEAGGTAASAPAEVAERTDVLITCLPNTSAVDRVVRGEDGILAGCTGEETLLEMSTISPVVTEDLADAVEATGMAMLDAPMSGGESGAIDGSLTIMVGGDATILAEHRPILEVMGDRIVHCGPVGAGQVTKACNQIVVANTMVAVSEALVLAERAGADLDAVVAALTGGAAGCWTLEHRAPRMIRGEFDPGFFASYQLKDLRIATEAAAAVNAPMPVSATTTELYKSMVAMGLGEDDNAGIIQVIERLAGTTARIEQND